MTIRSTNHPDTRSVLVLRLGALGDVVLSFAPFAAIRAAHPKASITLLTSPSFEALIANSPWFDDIWIDERPGKWDITGWWRLRRRLRGGGFDLVYDLQTSDRSSFYFQLMRPGPPDWSGIARGCSLPHANQGRDDMHTVERQRDQLEMAGIAEFPAPVLDFLAGDISRFNLPARYVLLVPGGAKSRPAKRWPVESYAELAQQLIGQGVAPVIIGGPDEPEIGLGIKHICGEVIDLTCETEFTDIAALARKASGAIGNDTGPMHLIAALGCPAVVLFSGDSDPALTAPRAPAGRPSVVVLREENIENIPSSKVAAALSLR